MAALLELRNLSHAYDQTPVVRNLGMALDRGQIGCLLGGSGCGKTTVLRCIAGFEPLTAGEIVLNGSVVSRTGYSTPPEQRHIGMVFQDYALFPHLDVARNIAFGLHRMPAGERDVRVAELLATIGLTEVRDNFPHELSGGQQQRVALARALAPRPDLILLDEPFSNLDVELRDRLSVEVRDILKQQNATAILVTHDQHEAFNIADEIGIMKDGSIVQWDSAYNLYHRPANRYVANFIGQGAFLPGKVVDPHCIRLEIGLLDGAAAEWQPGTMVDVLLRPDDIQHDDDSPLRAQVVHKAFRGAQFLYTLRLPGGGEILSLVPSHHNHAMGETIGIRLEVNHLVAFARDAG